MDIRKASRFKKDLFILEMRFEELNDANNKIYDSSYNWKFCHDLGFGTDLSFDINCADYKEATKIDNKRWKVRESIQNEYFFLVRKIIYERKEKYDNYIFFDKLFKRGEIKEKKVKNKNE